MSIVQSGLLSGLDAVNDASEYPNVSQNIVLFSSFKYGPNGILYSDDQAIARALASLGSSGGILVLDSKSQIQITQTIVLSAGVTIAGIGTSGAGATSIVGFQTGVMFQVEGGGSHLVGLQILDLSSTGSAVIMSGVGDSIEGCSLTNSSASTSPIVAMDQSGESIDYTYFTNWSSEAYCWQVAGSGGPNTGSSINGGWAYGPGQGGKIGDDQTRESVGNFSVNDWACITTGQTQLLDDYGDDVSVNGGIYDQSSGSAVVVSTPITNASMTISDAFLSTAGNTQLGVAIDIPEGGTTATVSLTLNSDFICDTGEAIGVSGPLASLDLSSNSFYASGPSLDVTDSIGNTTIVADQFSSPVETTSGSTGSSTVGFGNSGLSLSMQEDPRENYGTVEVPLASSASVATMSNTSPPAYVQALQAIEASDQTNSNSLPTFLDFKLSLDGGALNDDDAFARAVSWCSDHGCALIIDSGVVIHLTKTVEISSNLQVIGDGTNTVYSSASDAFDIEPMACVSIQGLKIMQTANWGPIVTLAGNGSSIVDCSLENSAGNSSSMVIFGGANEVIQDSSFVNNDPRAYCWNASFIDASNHLDISSAVIGGSASGVGMGGLIGGGSSQGRVEGFQILDWDCSTTGATQVVAQDVFSLQIKGGEYSGASSAAICLGGGALGCLDVQIVGNTITSEVSDTGTSGIVSSKFSGGGVNDLIVTGNTVSGFANGIALEDGTGYGTVSNNDVSALRVGVAVADPSGNVDVLENDLLAPDAISVSDPLTGWESIYLNGNSGEGGTTTVALGSKVSLDGPLSPSDLANLTGGGSVYVGGVLQNSGSILDLSSFTDISLVFGDDAGGGEIDGGTLQAGGRTFTASALNRPTRFSGVTVEGTLDFTGNLQLTDTAVPNGVEVEGGTLLLDGEGNLNVLSQGTGDVITGDSGANLVVVTGTATVNSQSATSDTIVANTGSTLTANVTGKYANIMENAATVHATETGDGDNSVMDVTGGNAIIYGGAGAGLNVRTTAGVSTTVTLGTGNGIVVSQGTGDVITGDSGANLVVVTGTATVNSQSATSDTIVANTGSTLTANVTGKYANIMENAATVHATETGDGDNSVMDVTGGNAIIYGGAGAGLNVRTTAGVSTTVTLGTGNGIVVSQGTGDVITGDSGANLVVVTGTATVNSQSATSDTIVANTGSTLTANVTGKYANIMENAATVHATETGDGDNSVMDVTGGNAIIYGGAGAGLNVRTTAGVSTTVTLGTGNGIVVSQGTGDVITGDSGANLVVVTGTATVNSQSATSDTIVANTGSTLTANVTGKYANIMENAATVHATETGDGDNSVMDVTGGNAIIYGGAGAGLNVRTTAGVSTTVTLGTGNGIVVSQGTGDVITGDSGANLVVVTGTATVNSQSATSDTIVANTGSTLTANVTGKYANIMENAATVHATETGDGDNSVMDVTGGNAIIYGGAGAGLNVRTTAGVSTTVTLGTGNGIVVSQGTGDVITGDSGANLVVVTGTATVNSQSATSDTIVANTGSTLTANVTGKYANIMENAATVHATETGDGDNSVMDVTGGNAIIYGGAGAGLNVRTTAGVSTTVTLGTGNGIVVSQGTGDVITGDSGANLVVVTGTATVNSQSATSDTIVANTGSTLTANVTGKYANIMENAATVHATETGDGDNSVMDVTGGNAIIYGGAGAGLNVRTTAGVSTTVTLGNGNGNVVSLGNDTIFAGSGRMNFFGGNGTSSVIGGSGAMTIFAGTGNADITGSSAGDAFFSGGGNATFQEGSGNNLAVLGLGSADVVGGNGTNTYYFEAGTGIRFQEIENYHVGRDSVAFEGFSGSVIADQSVSSGSLILRLTDGDVVRFDGVDRLN